MNSGLRQELDSIFEDHVQGRSCGSNLASLVLEALRFHRQGAESVRLRDVAYSLYFSPRLSALPFLETVISRIEKRNFEECLKLSEELKAEFPELYIPLGRIN